MKNCADAVGDTPHNNFYGDPILGIVLAEQSLRGGALPLYIKISELLSREIAAGIWPDGSRLPTEADLSAHLGVAIGTLRKALADLEDKQLLERIQGSGTYVRNKAKTGSIYEFLHLEAQVRRGLAYGKNFVD
ncbi:Histidine utilization repressor [Nymphon striatum]|nr:Histidine utilization repressor [Nymphon striatum]